MLRVFCSKESSEKNVKIHFLICIGPGWGLRVCTSKDPQVILILPVILLDSWELTDSWGGAGESV